jgi:hypothetical protein
VQFAIELLTIDPGPPRFFLRVTQGAERPNLKIAVPLLRGDKGSVLLYRHAFKIEGIQTCSVARVLGQLYSFHHLALDSCSFVFRDCFGQGVPVRDPKGYNFMYNFFHHRYYIVCNHAMFSHSISSRCGAIRELVAKEREYRAFLKAFPTNVFPEFEKRKDLFCGAAKFLKSINPLKAIMDGLPAITRLHTDGIGKALEAPPITSP